MFTRAADMPRFRRYAHADILWRRCRGFSRLYTCLLLRYLMRHDADAQLMPLRRYVHFFFAIDATLTCRRHA